MSRRATGNVAFPAPRDDSTCTILHVDMDAFYASVELLSRPMLRGQPVIVGGSGSRGVVLSATYEARAFGVRAAMSMGRARRLCPEATVISPDHRRYARVSDGVMEIFRSVTAAVEPLSLDEAFLDISGALRRFGSPTTIAELIRARVFDEQGITCSVGGAPNKFVAKVASGHAKPDGMLLIPADSIVAFLHPLPVQALWGVGPATLERLQRLGVRTVRDLAELPVTTLVHALGQAQGRHLHDLAWAVDDRPVEAEREVKSIGHEETFASDRFTFDELHAELVRLADAVSARLRTHGAGARTVTVKLKFADFTLVSRAHTLPSPVATTAAILAAADELLAGVELRQGVRLLGVSVSNFGEPAEQLSFEALLHPASAAAAPGPAPRAVAATPSDAWSPADWTTATDAIDAIRERFGTTAIGPASTLSATGLRLARRGAQQWGPDHDPPATPGGDGRSR